MHTITCIHLVVQNRTHLTWPNTQHSSHIGKKKSQTELIVEIYSKSLVRAIGKELLMKFSKNTN